MTDRSMTDRSVTGRSVTGRVLSAGLYGVALMLGGTTLVLSMAGKGQHAARDRDAAQVAVRRIAEAERASFARHGRYATFGSTAAERRVAVPGVDLGPAVDADFSFDALLDQEGTLHIRAVSRAEAVRTGRVAPLLEPADLVPENRVAENGVAKNRQDSVP